MKKTKELILETALALFNKHGLPKVTLRTIAQEMGISQGNLNYHYKKRENIIEALYFQLVQNIDDSFAITDRAELPTENIVHVLLNMADTVMMNFYEYRFIVVDFVQIIRDNDKVRLHYQQLTHQREQQFFLLLNLFIEQKLIRPPLLVDEYNNMFKRVQIMGNYWILHVITTTDNGVCQADMFKYSEILNQNIYPYLTEMGRADYHSYVSAFKKEKV